jgi:hypothetical protein
MERVLADGKTVWTEQIDGPLFTELVISHLPELADVAREHHGLMHLQTAAIGEALVGHAAAGELDQALQILTFFDELLTSNRQTSEFENALEISFITALELSGTFGGREVLERAPARIRSILNRAV